MDLPQFLEIFFRALNERGVAWCVLRNHEGLPQVNAGDDIDLLVARNSFAPCIDALTDIPGVRITALARRSYAAHIFLEGVETGLHLHVSFTFSWRGLRYLDEGAVLSRSRSAPSWPLMRIADPVDGAVASFVDKFLWNGTVKQKRRQAIRDAFGAHPGQVRSALAAIFGEHLSRDLVAAVNAGRFDDLPRLARSARSAFVGRSLVAAPLRSLSGVSRYLGQEARLRLKASNVTTIAVMGVDGAGKTTLLDSIEPTLAKVVGNVTRMKVHPRLIRNRDYQPDRGVSHNRPHEGVKRGWAWSCMKVCAWSAEIFAARILFAKRAATLLLFDRYFDDVELDPVRYRYGGPRWLLRLLRAITVRPDLWILLDAPPEVLYQRKQEISFEEVKRQREGYLRLLQRENNVLIIESTLGVERNSAIAREAIVAQLVRTAAAQAEAHSSAA